MKRKFLVVLLGLVFCLCVFLVESKPILAEEWTAEQKEVVDWFNKYVAVCFEGGADKVMSFFHPEYIEWDFRQEAPIDFKQKKEVEEYFENQNYKLTSFDVKPLVIQIKDHNAIAHVNYKMSYKDSEGKVTEESGRWSAVLINQDGKWFFLSNIWIAE
jgi:hypothetical protein